MGRSWRRRTRRDAQAKSARRFASENKLIYATDGMSVGPKAWATWLREARRRLGLRKRAAFASRVRFLRRSAPAFAGRLRAFVGAATSPALADAGLVVGRDARGGVGLFAARALPGGFQLRVPREFILDVEAAALAPLARALDGEAEVVGLGPFSPVEHLLAALADARGDGGAPFHAYAAALPDDAPEALLGPPFRLFCARVARCASGSHLDEAALAWARAAFRSRAFSSRAGAEAAMVPLVDLLNHSDGAVVRIDADESALTLTNAAPLRAGEEAFNNYGADRSDEDLLSNYGITR